MKLDRHELRQIIKEVVGDLSETDWKQRTGGWDWYKQEERRISQQEPAEYLAWVADSGHATSGSSSVLATYIIDVLGKTHPNGLPGIRTERKVIGRLADLMKINRYDVLADVQRQFRESQVTQPTDGIDEDGIEEIEPNPSP
jgi:hypothetical protein